jgi:hypothetical protein
MATIMRTLERGIRRALPSLFFVLFVSSPLHAAAPSTITLRDGSTITGEVVSLSDGVYTIKSATLGMITVKESDVRSMTKTAAAAPDPGQMGALQERMTSDPDTMSTLTALQDDPELKAVLNDPEVLNALQSGNVDALLANPKVAHLADDPKVQEITKKLGY